MIVLLWIIKGLGSELWRSRIILEDITPEAHNILLHMRLWIAFRIWFNIYQEVACIIQV